MTKSPLAKRTIPSHNKYSSRQGMTINRVVLHHWAGTNGGLERLQNPSERVSANYAILTDGTIVSQVPEEFRAWTSGSLEADGGSITIETQNIRGRAPGKNDADSESWPVSEAAYASIIALLADVAKRYKFGGISAGSLRGHKEFAATACPGGFLWTRLGDIRAQAAKALGAPVTPTPPVKGKTIYELATETLAGLHGSGEQRKQSLGSQYDAVQAEVNRRLGTPTTKPSTPGKSLAQYADEVMAGVHGSGDARKKSLGNNYAAVQAEVNRRLGAGKSSGGPNISALADAVLRGDYGDGPSRKVKLGGNYAAVQAEVNRRLKL